MKKRKIHDRSVLLTIFIAAILLCISVYLLMNHVQDLLNKDVKINLTEIVTQNKDVIATKLKLETNNVKVMADNISEKIKQSGHSDQEYLQECLKNLTTASDDVYMAISDTEGNAVFRNGSHIDISARNYFKLAITGEQNISEKLISRLDGQDLYIICTPIYYNNAIIGTLQKGYTPTQMYNLCSVSLFSDKGNMFIINSDGYIVFHSQQEGYSQETDNYYRSLYSDGNTEAATQLEKDIQNNKSGFFESTYNNSAMFSAYTPIDNIHDWFLITSVPVNAVSPNGEIVVTMFYFILIFVVMIITFIALVFLWYKNKQQQALKRIAFVDTITNGSTYNKFVIDVEKALFNHPDKKFYILKFDIDNFKYINNYYGFDFGDDILSEIQKCVTKDFVNHETLARISGDQFVALLEDATEVRIQKILDDINKTNNTVSIYCSAGVYEILDHDEPINIMVDKARTAAQTVKGVLNKKIAYFEDSFNQSSAHNEQLKRAIIQAIDNDEFVAFYQPKVDIETKQLIGSEALVRWIANDRIIPPMEFIPLCEKTGIIADIDMLVFEKVLKFLKHHLDNGVQCTPISVNFSRLHLTNPDFVNKLSKTLDFYQVPASLIEIELTESAFFDNSEIIYSFTEELHKHGFRMAMDDFGSGYSSLNMLKDIPIDVLKIDKEFLSSKNEKRKEIIFASIVQMAHKLGISIVVEGVETKENIRLMAKCHCTVAQGYYFARPMNEESFEKIFMEEKL